MAQLKVPDAPTEHTTIYADLLGVDFQSDQTEVDKRRSPDMVNMISDLGGNPVKRCGYRAVSGTFSSLVQTTAGLWGAVKQAAGVRVYELAKDAEGNIETSSSELLAGTEHVGDIKHVINFRNNMYILCQRAWIAYDTEEGTAKMIGSAEDVLYTLNDTEVILIMPDESAIPVVMTMYKPNGKELVTLPDGTDITGATEGVNLLTPFQTVEYCVQTDTASKVKFNVPNVSKMSPVLKVEVRDSSTYEWVETADYTTSSKTSRSTVLPDASSTAATTKTVGGYITFNESPYVSVTEDGEDHLRFRDAQTVDVPAGEPNVRITFAPFRGSSRGYYNKTRNRVLRTNAATLYDARVFAAVNSDAYYSIVNNPLKVYDNYYFSVDSNIVAFAKTSSALAVVGEDTGDNKIYLAKGEYNESFSMPVYTVTASDASVGSVASKVVGTLNDEPLLLSRSGLFGMSTNYRSEKYAISRSGKINRKLCREENLDDAVGLAFNNYFYLAVNGHMYVLDGRHRDQSKSGDSSYECYYFEGLPDITDMYVLDGKMYFTDGTNVYTWNDDLPETQKYYDNLVLSNGEVASGTPVYARWCTPFDDDGAPQRLKTLMKKGTSIVLVPYYSSGCDVTLVKDGDVYEELGRFSSSVTSFEYIDFSSFSFSSNAVAADVFTKKKIKKYKRLQIILENNNPEPFGLVKVVKTYTYGNYAKR